MTIFDSSAAPLTLVFGLWRSTDLVVFATAARKASFHLDLSSCLFAALTETIRRLMKNCCSPVAVVLVWSFKERAG